MVAASSADAPAACSSALAISIRRSAGTFGMASSLPGCQKQGGQARHCQPRREWRSLTATDDGRNVTMPSQANVYASVAGTVGRSDKDKGVVGVFRRPAETGVWEHVISELDSNTVYVHPTDPNIVFAGTHDGVYRSTDR